MQTDLSSDSAMLKEYRTNLDLNRENGTYFKAFSRIEPGWHVLEVGCSDGAFGRALHELKHCTVVGMDINAKQMTPENRATFADFHTLNLDEYTCKPLPDLGQFDAIICLDVLEHLKEPFKALQCLSSCLKPNGMFIASIPHIAHGAIQLDLMAHTFNYKSKGILDDTHLKFFTESSIRRHLAEGGFHLQEIDSILMPLTQDLESSLSHFPLDVLKFVGKNLNSYIYQLLIVFYPKKKLSPGSNASSPPLTYNTALLKQFRLQFHKKIAALPHATLSQKISLSVLRRKIKSDHV
jgi:O-antigen biosynthesis protein